MKNFPQPADFRIPIVIGVSGHRDIPDAEHEKLREVLNEIFGQLQKTYPHSPFVLLSCLAEGGDQLAAEVAIARGFSLIMPHAMPLSIYEADFASSESLNSFKVLVSRCATTVEISDFAERETGRAANLSIASERARRYALAGAYIVQHSSILVALWDGTPSTALGGTADVVGYRMDDIPSALDEDWNPMQFRENGLVYVVKTPRLRHIEPLRDSFAVFTRSASERMSKAVSAELKRIDDLNCEWEKRDRAAFEAGYSSSLLPDTNADAASDSNQPNKELEGRYKLADYLAIRAQRNAKHYLLTILILAFTATLAVNQLNKSQSVWLFALCAAATATAYGIHFYGIRRGRTQLRHQDYRAIAEALRVQCFWTHCGIGARAQRFFLQNASDDSAWVRSALRFSSAALPQISEPPREGTLKFVMDEWISGQRQYFENAFRRQLAKNMALSSLKFCLLLIAGLFKLLPDTIKWLTSEDLTRTGWFVMAQLAIAVLLIAFHVWSRVKELRAQQSTFELLGVQTGERARRKVSFWSPPSGLLLMVVGAFGATALLCALVTRGAVNSEALSELCEMIFVASASAAAMIHIYGHVNAFSDHLRQYSRMFSLFAHAERLLHPEVMAGNLVAARKIIYSLGRESLSEAGEWLRLHRARPIEVPKV